MKTVFFIFAFACLMGYTSKAQIAPAFTDSSSSISIGADGQFQSNAVPHEFLHPFLFGGFIDQPMKDNAASYLKADNLLGLEFGGSLKFNSGIKQNLLGFSKAFWGLEIGTRFLSFSNYSSDLFNLAFYGNNPYVGENMALGGGRTNTLWFHEISLAGGFQSEGFGPFDRFELLLQPSFYLGIQNIEAQLEKADLLTETNGEFINIDFKGSYSISDTTSDPFQFNGFGGGLDFEVKTNIGKSFLALSVQDLGVISFKNQFNYELDSAFTFNGYYIEDIFNIKDSLTDIASVQDSLLNAQEGSNTVFLPFRIGLYFEIPLVNNINWGTFVQYRLIPEYLPFVQTRIKYQTSDELFYAALSGAYGGYGGFQAGIHLGLNLSGVSIELGTSNFLGFVSMKTQRSQGVYAQLAYHF